MPSGDYESLEWIPRNLPKDNLVEKAPVPQLKTPKKSLSLFLNVKKDNVPWHMHRSRITHKYCEVSKGKRDNLS